MDRIKNAQIFGQQIRTQPYLISRALGLELNITIEEEIEALIEYCKHLDIVKIMNNEEWMPGRWATEGWIAKFNGKNYRCIKSHPTQLDWEPADMPMLWVDAKK